MKTVAIIEGFSGGPKLTAKFRRSLTDANYQIVKSRSSADVLIAHSAGCHGLPKTLEAELILLIDPPYWPSKPLMKRFKDNYQKIRKHDIEIFGHAYYRRKRLWQAFYTITKNKYMWLGLLKDNNLDFLKLADNRQIVVIRNSNDTFCGPEIKATVANLSNVAYVEFPGFHDDYCTNPRPYIELLQKALKR